MDLFFLCSIVYTYLDHHLRNLHKKTNTLIYNVNRVPYLDFTQKEVQALIKAKKGENKTDDAVNEAEVCRFYIIDGYDTTQDNG